MCWVVFDLVLCVFFGLYVIGYVLCGVGVNECICVVVDVVCVFGLVVVLLVLFVRFLVVL